MNLKQQKQENSMNRCSFLRPLPVLDRYIFREFMIPFSILIVAFIFLFMIGDIYNDLTDFLDSDHATIGNTIHYFMLKVPGNVRFILPISLLLACMYTMANMGKCLEITAMRACGISLMRCGGAIYIVAILITGVTFVLNEGIVPDLEREAYVMRKEARHKGLFNYIFQCLSYHSEDRGRTWFFNQFLEDGNIKEPFVIHRYRDDGSLAMEYQIDSGTWEKGKGWILNDCKIIKYTVENSLPSREESVKKIVLNAVEFPETPKDIALSIKPPDELPILSIVKKLQNGRISTRLRAKYETIFYYRLAFPWACLVGVMMGIPLAGKSARSGIMLSIINATVLIVVYLVFAQIFNVLGQNDVIPSMLAGLAPTLIFLGYGVWSIIKSD